MKRGKRKKKKWRESLKLHLSKRGGINLGELDGRNSAEEEEDEKQTERKRKGGKKGEGGGGGGKEGGRKKAKQAMQMGIICRQD